MKPINSHRSYPKSAKLRHYSHSLQNIVRFFTDCLKARKKFTLTFVHEFILFASLNECVPNNYHLKVISRCWGHHKEVQYTCPGKILGKIIFGGKCPFVRTNLFVPISIPSIFCPYYFLSIQPLISCLSNCCPYLCPIVQQAHGTYFRNILKLLRNNMGLNDHNLSHNTLKQVIKHSTQNSIS